MPPQRDPFHWFPMEDVEDIRRYTTGGFHPIILGDIITADSPPRKYRILHKLGIGAYSTVWLAEMLHPPSKRLVALMIYIADANSQNDLKIFSRIPESKNLIQLLDNFSIQGPNGLHTVLFHDVLGSPTSLIGSPTRSGHKVLCRQIAQGLVDLHSHGIVHGDIHLGNVGIALPTLNDYPVEDIVNHFGNPECSIVLTLEKSERSKAFPAYLVTPIPIMEYLTRKDPAFHEASLRAEIMDFGNAFLFEEESRPFYTPPVVCAPELFFELVVNSVRPPPTRASDIWSFACTIYELVFKAQLFDTGLFQLNDMLLGKMATLCGEVPSSWKSYWESKKELRTMSISHEAADAAWQFKLDCLTNSKLTDVPTKADISEFLGLIRSMLKMNPGSRPSAVEVLQHPWFTRGKLLTRESSI